MTVLMMLRRNALFLCLSLLDLAASAQAAEKPVISLAMHYTDARYRMIEAGFHPFQVVPPESAAYQRSFAYRFDIPKRFPEAVECAPTGQSPCNFLFVRGSDEIVEITTIGEHPEALLVRKVRVVSLAEAEALYEQ